MPFLYAPIAMPIRPRAVPGARRVGPIPHMAMTPTEADKTLADSFAPWVLAPRPAGRGARRRPRRPASVLLLSCVFPGRSGRHGRAGALSGRTPTATADTAIVIAVPGVRGVRVPVTTVRQSPGFRRAVAGWGCPDQGGRHPAGPADGVRRPHDDRFREGRSRGSGEHGPHTSGLTRSAIGRQRSVVNSAPNPPSSESAHRMRNQVTASGSSAQARPGTHVIGEVCRIRRGDSKRHFAPPRHGM